MAGGIVGWHFCDVESGLVPEDASLSSLPSGGRGRIVVLAATPFTISKGWAARAAISVAKEWSKEGLRIFLMDLGLEDPTLHLALDLPNGEGVSDAFLYGASVQHIASPVLDDAFFFASAGSTPPDPEEVLGHPRWNDLAGGFSEADATLLLFLPTDIPGAGKILSRASDIIFLSAQGESADSHLGPASIKVMAMMGPFGSPPEEIPEAVETPVNSEVAPAVEEEGKAEAGSLADSDPDSFGAGLDLADGFGGEGGASEEDSSSFDFSGGLELAGGFGEEEAPLGAEPDTEGVTADQGDSLDFGEDSEAEDAPSFGGDLGLVEEGEDDGFGDDLVVGAGFSGGLELEGADDGPSDSPDFGADFVDFSPGDDQGSDEGDFGGDLVQGPDFGGGPSVGTETESMDNTLPETPEPATDAPAPSEAPSREAPKRRRPPKKKFPFGLVAGIVIFLGAVGTVAGTAFGYLNVPGLTFLQDYVGGTPDPPLTLAGPQPNEEVLRFSLVLFNYEQEDVGDATDMLDALRSRLPELLFILVPGEAAGESVFTLLAGPALDRIQAEDLRDPLAAVLSREDPESWAVRETSLAFYLGERETLAEAQDYMDSFGSEGLYPYVLHVTYPDGSEGYEVLSGAFEGVLDARPLQLALRDGGFRDVPLIERRGRLPE
jgi:hypothetical protein